MIVHSKSIHFRCADVACMICVCKKPLCKKCRNLHETCQRMTPLSHRQQSREKMRSYKCMGNGSTVTGLTLISEETLSVVCGLSSLLVYVIDSETGKVLCTKKLKKRPFAITCLQKNQMAVTVPTLNRIKIFRYNDRNITISEEWSLDVNGCCSGIGYHDNKFVVTFLDPQKVEIISSTNGEIIHFIKSTLSLPKHVAVSSNGDTFMVSGKRAVSLMNWHGGKIREYENKDLAAKGITASSNGEFLVFDRNGIIHVISMEGYHSNSVETKETKRLNHNSRAIYCDSVSGFVYVSSGDKTSSKGIIRAYSLESLSS